VKANGYLEKPFSQGDLLKIIFQHIVWKFRSQFLSILLTQQDESYISFF
jgi:hypothetical protein